MTDQKTQEQIRSEWRDKSNVVKYTAWAWNHYVARTDCYAAYNLEGEAFCSRGGDGDCHLTPEVIALHCRGDKIIGVYSTEPEQHTCIWLTWDIDAHDDRADPAKNLQYALAKYTQLVELGFRPLLTDSNGKGGYHLTVFLANPVPARTVRAFGLWLVRDHKDHGLAVIEVFPKQAYLAGAKKIGNQVRLPGHHHRKDHWSRVWDDGQWLDGTAAIEHMCVERRCDPALIPQEAAEYLPPPKAKTVTSPSSWADYKPGDDWPLNYGGDLRTLDVEKLFGDRVLGVEGDHLLVRCPWVEEHTDQREVGTAVWQPRDGKFAGWNCMHAHCSGRTLEDVLAYFGRAAVDACCEKTFGDPARRDEEQRHREMEAAVADICTPADRVDTSRLPDAPPPPPEPPADPDDAKFRDWNRPKSDPKYAPLLRWGQIRSRALSDRPVYIIQHALAGGEVQMPCSLPWGGKSTILAHAVACVIQGKSFFGLTTTPVPVLYLNADRNGYDLFYNRIFPHLDGEGGQTAMEERFFAPEFENLQTPFPTDYIEHYLDQVQAATGATTVWVIVDTMRAAYMSGAETGSENDSSFVVSTLTPLRATALKRGCAITAVHHNNRASDDYAGSAGIAGCIDTFWRISRDPDSSVATLRISNRRGFNERYYVERHPDGTLTTQVQEAPAGGDKKKAHEKSDRLIEFIQQFPSTVADAITDDAIRELPWVKAKGWTGKTIRNRISEAEQPGHPRLELTEDGRYYRV